MPAAAVIRVLVDDGQSPRALQFGVNTYVVKPFTVATLREKIDAVFGALT